MIDAIAPELAVFFFAACPLVVAWAIAPLDEHKGRHQPRARDWPSARTRTGTAANPAAAVPLILAGTRGHIRIEGEGENTAITTVRREPWYSTVGRQAAETAPQPVMTLVRPYVYQRPGGTS